jgi:hypothetical protein
MKALAFPSLLLGKPVSVIHLSSNSVESPTSSPHAGHFFVSVVEYTTPQMVHTLRDCLLTAILLADIGRKSPEGIKEAIHNISNIHSIPNMVPG